MLCRLVNCQSALPAKLHAQTNTLWSKQNIFTTKYAFSYCVVCTLQLAARQPTCKAIGKHKISRAEALPHPRSTTAQGSFTTRSFELLTSLIQTGRLPSQESSLGHLFIKHLNPDTLSLGMATLPLHTKLHLPHHVLPSQLIIVPFLAEVLSELEVLGTEALSSLIRWKKMP